MFWTDKMSCIFLHLVRRRCGKCDSLKTEEVVDVVVLCSGLIRCHVFFFISQKTLWKVWGVELQLHSAICCWSTKYVGTYRKYTVSSVPLLLSSSFSFCFFRLLLYSPFIYSLVPIVSSSISTSPVISTLFFCLHVFPRSLLSPLLLLPLFYSVLLGLYFPRHLIYRVLTF
uniref:Uncharacterized protein n=1 Tax=Cacopsylla melanoneura TaxID=428564 RepID=A0A8D9E9N2_9HEMI